MRKLFIAITLSIGLLQSQEVVPTDLSSSAPQTSDEDWQELLEKTVIELYDIGAIKFGSFTFRSGIQSPYYVDIRAAVSHPRLLRQMSDLMWQRASSLSFDLICGVPYGALALGTTISVQNSQPMIFVRKETKDHGTKQMVEGVYGEGQEVLIIEDVITSGGSIETTSEALFENGLRVKDAVAFLDWEKGGVDKVGSSGITVHPVLTISELFSILEKAGRLVESPTLPLQENKKALSFAERATLTSHPLSKKLFSLMEEKQTNLAASADISDKEELLTFADEVGPYICVLKTHADIIDDFDDRFIEQLQEIANKHQFLLFEDRKFADIGNTVIKQYTGGVHKISSWAQLINAHALPGPSIIEALEKVGKEVGSGLLLIPQLSSKNALTSDYYAKKTVEFALENPGFVLGFIAQKKLTDDPNFIHFMPGISLKAKNDKLGQCYTTPFEGICDKGADIIIVGRGLYKAEDYKQAAEEYRDAAWSAYQYRLQ